MWNRLTEVDSSNNATLRSYGYDYNGNQVSQTAYTKTYGTSYMRSNLPDTSFIGSSLNEIYQYNTGDSRIYKKLSDNTISNYYLIDLAGKSLAEYDFTTSSWKYDVYGKERIGTYSSNFEFDINDHIGTERLAYTVRTLNCSPVSVQYNISNVNDIYAFGKALRTFNATSISEYSYQGSQRETELSSNDYYTHYRGLDADLGKWKQIDPKISDSESPYASMSNNPVSLNDQNGDTPGNPECKTCPPPSLQKVERSNQDVLVTRHFATEIPKDPRQRIAPQAQVFQDNRGSYEKQEDATYTHQLTYGGGNGKGGFVDKYYETKHAVIQFVDKQPATIQIAIFFVAPEISVEEGATVISTKVGTTVLGHYPEYVRLAESIGARTFQVPTNVWNKMSPVEQWAANSKFLDRMIKRGDNIMLATPLNQVKPGSFFQKELNYLFDKGYKVTSDGLGLIK